MSTAVNISTATVAPPATSTTAALLPKAESLRFRLRVLSYLLMGFAIIGTLCALRTFYFGYALGVFCKVVTAVTLNHTEDAHKVLTGSCCWGPKRFFATQRTLFAIYVVGTVIGIPFCAAGIVLNRGPEGIDRFNVMLAIIALCACVVSFVLAIVTAVTCGQLHGEVDAVVTNLHNNGTTATASPAHARVVVSARNNRGTEDDSSSQDLEVYAGSHPQPVSHPNYSGPGSTTHQR